MSEPPVLHVLEIGTIVTDDGERLPRVLVDATAHPCVKDLTQVEEGAAIRDISTEALCLPWGAGHLFLLGVRVVSPAPCAFAIGFTLPAHRAVLNDAVKAGRLAVATGVMVPAPVNSAGTDGVAEASASWLAVDLDSESLTAALPG